MCSGSNVMSTAYRHAELENAWSFMSTQPFSWYFSMQYVTCRDIRERTQRGLNAAGIGTTSGLHGFSTNLVPPRNCMRHKVDIKQVPHSGSADIERHRTEFNPLNAELNPICYLLALLGAYHFLHVSRIRVKSLALRQLMSYIYGAPIFDVSRSHTTTHHSR